jgi:hypothetical protein
MDAELADRVAKIENKLVAMDFLLKMLEAKFLPYDGDTV